VTERGSWIKQAKCEVTFPTQCNIKQLLLRATNIAFDDSRSTSSTCKPCPLHWGPRPRLEGDAENATREHAGHENAAPCCRNAGVENARRDSMEHRVLHMSVRCRAGMHCMSRQERAPDLAADCILVND